MNEISDARTQGRFERFANGVARRAGRPGAFGAAAGVVLLWALVGPLLGFSEVWQLSINTGTTIVTFLMVFLIQNTQNRDTTALQVKLDELIRSTKGAHNVLLDLEELTEDELEQVRRRYEELAERAREDLRRGRPDTGTKEKPGLFPS